MNGELGFKDWQEQDKVLEEQTTDKRIIQKYFTRYDFYINQSLFPYRLDLRSFWEIQTCYIYSSVGSSIFSKIQIFD